METMLKTFKMEKVVTTNKDFIKLHLGCGNRKIPGWINVDIREVNPDVIDDISKMEKFKKDYADIIYACHVLEHFGRYDTVKVLENWRKVLKPGGTLRLSVPDFEKIVLLYKITENMELLHGLLHAGQRNEYDIHYTSFDFKYLQKCLEKAGFTNVKRYNWLDTEHFYIDDGSQAYFPHLDKTNGIQMSLNVEANK